MLAEEAHPLPASGARHNIRARLRLLLHRLAMGRAISLEASWLVRARLVRVSRLNQHHRSKDHHSIRCHNHP